MIRSKRSRCARRRRRSENASASTSSPGGQPLRSRFARGERERRARRIDGCRRRRPGSRRDHGERSCVGEHVEHASTGGQIRDRAAALALVEVEARLVATADVDGERRAVLLEREQIGRLDTAEQPDALVEALALAHVDVGPLVHPVDAREPGERVGDGVTPPLGAGGGELDDHERAVAVGDQSRHAIRLGEDQPCSIRARQQRRSSRRRGRDPVGDERVVDHVAFVEAPDAADDLRARAVGGVGQERAVGRFDDDRVARLWVAGDPGHGPAEDPGVPALQRAFAAGAQAEGGGGHRPDCTDRVRASPGRVRLRTGSSTRAGSVASRSRRSGRARHRGPGGC